MSSKKLPYGKIHSIETLGIAVRERRKSIQLTQTELAGVSGVGVRFISDLENGKSTCEIGKVFTVLQQLGLEILLTPRSWQTIKKVIV